MKGAERVIPLFMLCLLPLWDQFHPASRLDTRSFQNSGWFSMRTPLGYARIK